MYSRNQVILFTEGFFNEKEIVYQTWMGKENEHHLFQ